MSGLGKQVRLNRILGHPSGRMFSVAVDHFVGYAATMQDGLVDLPTTIGKMLGAGPDAVTMLAGTARSCWPAHAGRTALIIQAGCFTPDDRVSELLSTPEEALSLGADAIAVAIGVRGPSEGRYLRMLADTVRAADRLELPVFAHIYPRHYVDGQATIVTDPEEIAWAARCGIECGADVVKIAYSGDKDSFAEIVSNCPRPVVAAGGARTPTLDLALRTAQSALAAGARGVTVGRNIWGAPDVEAAARAFALVIHDGKTPGLALDAMAVPARQ